MAAIGTGVASYEEACAQHRWEVPERYNIAADVCDKHPPRQARDGLGGLARQRSGASLGRAAVRSRTGSRTSCATHGVERGDRVAMLLPPTPETAAAFFGTWKLGAILLSMSVLYGDEGIRHRITRLAGQGAGHRRGQRRPRRPRPGRARADRARRRAARRRLDRLRDGRHRGRRPGAALLLVGHDRARQGHPPRAPLPARARGVRLLPRRARRRALPRHGRVGVGGRHRAAARAVAARRRRSSSSSARAASIPSSSSPCSRSTV